MLAITDGASRSIDKYLGVDVTVGDYNADGIPDVTWIGWAPGGVAFRGILGSRSSPARATACPSVTPSC